MEGKVFIQIIPLYLLPFLPSLPLSFPRLIWVLHRSGGAEQDGRIHFQNFIEMSNIPSSFNSPTQHTLNLSNIAICYLEI